MPIGNLDNNPYRQNSNPDLTQNQPNNVPFGAGVQQSGSIPNMTKKVQYAQEGNDPFSQLISAGDMMIHNAGQDYGSGTENPANYDIVDGLYDLARSPVNRYNARQDENNRIRPNTTNTNLNKSFLNNLGPNVNQTGTNDIERYNNLTRMHQEDDENNTAAMNIAHLSTREAMDAYHELLSGMRNDPTKQISSGQLYQMRRLHNELARRGINTTVFDAHSTLTDEERRQLIDQEMKDHNNRYHMFHEDPQAFHQRTRHFDFAADHPIGASYQLPAPPPPPAAPAPAPRAPIARYGLNIETRGLLNSPVTAASNDEIADTLAPNDLHSTLTYLQRRALDPTVNAESRARAQERYDALMAHPEFQRRYNRQRALDRALQPNALVESTPQERQEHMQHLLDVTADARYSMEMRRMAMERLNQIERYHDAVEAGAPPVAAIPPRVPPAPPPPAAPPPAAAPAPAPAPAPPAPAPPPQVLRALDAGDPEPAEGRPAYAAAVAASGSHMQPGMDLKDISSDDLRTHAINLNRRAYPHLNVDQRGALQSEISRELSLRDLLADRNAQYRPGLDWKRFSSDRLNEAHAAVVNRLAQPPDARTHDPRFNALNGEQLNDLRAELENEIGDRAAGIRLGIPQRALLSAQRANIPLNQIVGGAAANVYNFGGTPEQAAEARILAAHHMIDNDPRAVPDRQSLNDVYNNPNATHEERERMRLQTRVKHNVNALTHMEDTMPDSPEEKRHLYRRMDDIARQTLQDLEDSTSPEDKIRDSQYLQTKAFLHAQMHKFRPIGRIKQMPPLNVDNLSSLSDEDLAEHFYQNQLAILQHSNRLPISSTKYRLDPGSIVPTEALLHIELQRRNPHGAPGAIAAQNLIDQSKELREGRIDAQEQALHGLHGLDRQTRRLLNSPVTAQSTDRLVHTLAPNDLHRTLTYLHRRAGTEALDDQSRARAEGRYNALIAHPEFQRRYNRQRALDRVMQPNALVQFTPQERLEHMQHLLDISADARYSRSMRDMAVARLSQLESYHEGVRGLAPGEVIPPSPAARRAAAAAAAAAPGAPIPPPPPGHHALEGMRLAEALARAQGPEPVRNPNFRRRIRLPDAPPPPPPPAPPALGRIEAARADDARLRAQRERVEANQRAAAAAAAAAAAPRGPAAHPAHRGRPSFFRSFRRLIGRYPRPEDYSPSSDELAEELL